MICCFTDSILEGKDAHSSLNFRLDHLLRLGLGLDFSFQLAEHMILSTLRSVGVFQVLGSSKFQFEMSNRLGIQSKT